MKTVNHSYKSQRGVACILTEQEYLDLYNYRDKAKQKKITRLIRYSLNEKLTTSRALTPTHYLDNNWLKFIRDKYKIDLKYIRGFLYEQAQ